MVVTFVVALPFFCLLFYIAQQSQVRLIEQAKIQAESTVAAMGDAQATMAAHLHSLLARVVHLPFTEESDGKFVEALSALHPHHGDFFFVDAQGVVVETQTYSSLLSEYRIWNPPAFTSGQRVEYVPSVIDNSFVIGIAAQGKQPLPTMHFGYKVEKKENPSHILGISISPQLYVDLFSALKAPKGSVLYAADAQGTIIFSRPELPANAPRSFSPSMMKQLSRPTLLTGSFYEETREGKSLVFYEQVSYRGNTIPYAFMVLVVPEDSLQQEGDALFADYMWALMAGVCFVLLAAWITGRMLIQPHMRYLLQTGSKLHKDEAVLPSTRLPIAEFSSLAASMSDLATVSRQKEVYLKAILQQAEEAANTKQQFLRNMGHEVRTPLNAIIGMAYLTQKEEITLQQRSYLNSIHASGQVLLQVINDLLELAHLDLPNAALDRKKFAMKELFMEVRQRFSSIASAKGITLLFSVGMHVPAVVEGDPARLEQVIGHLVDNAIQYSGQGRILISCEVEDTRDNIAHLAITVRDFGQGIAPDKLVAIQKQLEEEDPQGNAALLGSKQSLGILLSQRIMLLMGGRISVVSEYGTGAAFTVHIPLKAQSSEAQQEVKTLRGLRVFVVDDDPIFLELLSSLLHNFGMRVTATIRPEEALDTILLADKMNDPYRFIIVDWKMPNYNGIELCASIKNDLALQSSPRILLISAFGNSFSQKIKQLAEVDAFLYKPANESTLFDSMMNLLIPQSEEVFFLDHQGQVEQNKKKLVGLSVFIVESDDSVANNMLELLAEADVRAHLVSSGKDALRFFTSHPQEAHFHMILVDMHMPRMDGAELARQIRRLPFSWAKDIPIIGLSAGGKQGIRLGLLNAGDIYDYITTPITPPDFFSSLCKWRPIVSIGDKNIRLRVQEFYALCAGKKLLPAVELFNNISGLLIPHLHEGRVNYLHDQLNAGRFDNVIRLLDKYNQEANIMQEGSIYE